MSDKLQALTLTEPVWLGQWEPINPFMMRRVAMFPVKSALPVFGDATIWRHSDGVWDFVFDSPGTLYARPDRYPTPEAAQAACEKAILDAWRTR